MMTRRPQQIRPLPLRQPADDPFLTSNEQAVRDRLSIWSTNLLLRWQQHPHAPSVPLKDACGPTWARLVGDLGEARAEARLLWLLSDVLEERLGPAEPDLMLDGDREEIL